MKEPVPDQHLADGVHAGLHWWAYRSPDAVNPVVTVTGFIGPHYVSETTELPDASPAKVRRWVETLLVAHHLRVAKAAARKGRGA